jgi:hypothetical protein
MRSGTVRENACVQWGTWPIEDRDKKDLGILKEEDVTPTTTHRHPSFYPSSIQQRMVTSFTERCLICMNLVSNE